MINPKKYYPVRSGNSLRDLKNWIKWAKENNPGQKFIIEDLYSKRMKTKGQIKDYWKARYRIGAEVKYMVYGTY